MISYNFVETLKAFFHSPRRVFSLIVVLMVINFSYNSYTINKSRVINEKQLKICNGFDNHRCENGGLLEYSEAMGFTCVCTHGYIGETCEKAKPITFIEIILSWIQQSNVNSGKPANWWRIFPFSSGRQLANVYAYHQNVLKSLEEAYYVTGNNTNRHNIDGRILPRSRPLMCPNNSNLPPLNILYSKVFERKSGQFQPDLQNRNLLFQAFYQYFILQFFDSDSKLTITASQLYGRDKASERSLRSFSDGKLKTLYFKKEHYALFKTPISHSNVYLKEYLDSTFVSSNSILTMFKGIWKSKILNPSPMLFVVSTIWVREHNRVCDMLLRMPLPKWTDEQIYRTARRIVTGQMMSVMINEILYLYTGQAYPLKLRPEVYKHRIQNINSSNTPIELILMMAVSSLPEQFNGNPIGSLFFGDNGQVLDGGLKNTLQFMVSQPMGKVTAHNDGPTTKPLTEFLLKLSREHAVQSFNNYRRRFGLPAYDSFYQLTKNWKTANELKNLYKSVDDVELLTGMLTESSRSDSLPTSTIMTQSFIINAILVNNLTNDVSWNKDTYGGKHMFDMVKKTTLKTLVCRNLDGCGNG
ncbi:prostaglandin G/H synthase 2-like [Melanaphis sacchari]|uniref:prostaglandin G/H synthase 2-like n=1 Tax=Melanaphis sacchari TaxID=742174 RepID=UPI000DC1368A|nr:prostaglandin G/H synthase 2-like [Melanaphis sacchari]